MKVRELILHQNNNILFWPKTYWFPSNKTIDYKDSISLKMFDSYRSVLNLDQNLRRLHLNITDLTYYKMQMFNSLVQLDQLEIECYYFHNCTLTLPNLRIFKFRPQCEFQKLKMKTPKLEALDCDDLTIIEIRQPETIKHLKTELYHSSLEEFKNLEVLDCGEIRNVNKEILSILSKLKVLCVYEIDAKKLEIEESRNLISKMSFIMKQKLVLRRTELKVYLQGVRLTDGNNLDVFKLDLDNTKFQLENYANLYNSLHFIDCVNYSDLTALTEQIPDDYFNKLFQVRGVEITTKVNRDHFIWFASKLNFLDSLMFKNASLDQSTIDHLLDFCDLVCLAVNEDQPLNLNFDCILKCKRLTLFKTDQPFPGSFDLALKAFSRLTKLKYFIFRKDDETVAIQRNLNHFNLICYPQQRNSPIFFKHRIEFKELSIYCNHLANTGVRTRSATKLIETGLLYE